MSYTRTRHAEVPYVAHEVVSYPASEHGGTMTVDVSGTVPVDISVYVDTDRSDNSIDHTNAALAGVAGAVTATEVAQVKAIRETGRRVSESAVRGFFGLVGNELSAKISESASTLKANMALLLSESESVENVHRQMETDYGAIKARYLRVFSTLDDELRRRIHEVNQQAFELGGKRRAELLREPYLKDACGSYAMMSTVHVGELKLACATAKRKAFGTVESLGRMSEATTTYQDAVRGALGPAAPATQEYLPVLYTSVDEDDPASPEWRLYQVEDASNDVRGNDALRGTVADYLARVPQEAWRPLSAQDKAQVDNCFMALLDKEAAEGGDAEDDLRRQRVRDEMLRLFQRGAPLTCTGAR